MRAVLWLALSVIALAADPATITVHPADSLGTISPKIFGHFTEETLSSYDGAISSEQIYNRKFEIPEQRETGFNSMGTPAGWEMLEVDGTISLLPDRNVWYSPSQSLRITRAAGSVPAGIQQSGFHAVMAQLAGGRIPEPFVFRRGEKYRVRLAIRNGSVRGPVTVALGESWHKPVAQHAFTLASGGEWKIYRCELEVTADAGPAKFIIWFDSPGVLWLDSVSMVRADLDDDGFRKDAIEITRRVKPASIRWPGGWFVSDYNWKHGIGPIDERPAEQNRAWLGYTTNDVGIDEFVALCRKLGAEPYVCVNVGTGSPEEAAELVEYANGAATTKWGRVRAANGHPQPYGIRDWNIGNEEYLLTIGGTTGSVYAERVPAFAAAMRRSDPTIKLVAVGAFDLDEATASARSPFYKFVRFLYDWNKQVLPQAGKVMDYYSIHHYDPGESVAGMPARDRDRAAMISAQDLEAKMNRLHRQMDTYAGRRYPVALDEWAVWLPYKPPPETPPPTPEEAKNAPLAGLKGPAGSLRDALAEAAVYNAMLRHPADFAMAHRTMLWGYAMGMIAIDRDKVALSPSALMLEMYASRTPCEAVKAEANGPAFDFPTRPGIAGEFIGVKGAQYLDVAARRCGGSLELFVLNRDLEHDIEATVNMALPAGRLEAVTLNAAALIDRNSFDEPERVHLLRSEVTPESGTFPYRFPAHSITLLKR